MDQAVSQNRGNFCGCERGEGAQLPGMDKREARKGCYPRNQTSLNKSGPANLTLLKTMNLKI